MDFKTNQGKLLTKHKVPWFVVCWELILVSHWIPWLKNIFLLQYLYIAILCANMSRVNKAEILESETINFIQFLSFCRLFQNFKHCRHFSIEKFHLFKILNSICWAFYISFWNITFSSKVSFFEITNLHQTQGSNLVLVLKWKNEKKRNLKNHFQ